MCGDAGPSQATDGLHSETQKQTTDTSRGCPGFPTALCPLPGPPKKDQSHGKGFPDWIQTCPHPLRPKGRQPSPFV